jgi:hypothetical protein
MSSRADREEAAAVLRRLLKAVESGELEAHSTRARALLRRLDGAARALEAADEKQRRAPDESAPGPDS